MYRSVGYVMVIDDSALKYLLHLGEKQMIEVLYFRELFKSSFRLRKPQIPFIFTNIINNRIKNSSHLYHPCLSPQLHNVAPDLQSVHAVLAGQLCLCGRYPYSVWSLCQLLPSLPQTPGCAGHSSTQRFLELFQVLVSIKLCNVLSKYRQI